MTHSEGCYAWRGHEACAKRIVEQQRDEIARLKRRVVQIDDRGGYYSVRIAFPKEMLAHMRWKVEDWIVDEIARAIQPEEVHPDKRSLRGEGE